MIDMLALLLSTAQPQCLAPEAVRPPEPPAPLPYTTAVPPPPTPTPRPPQPAPQIPDETGLAGTYTLQDGDPNTLVALELTGDGRFRFAMSAGYMDGTSEGRWTTDGKTVTLNTDPRPKLPEFAEGGATRTREAPLLIKVSAPNGDGVALIDLRVGFADGAILDGYTLEDGWRPNGYEEERQAKAKPAWVELSLLPFNVEPKRFPLDASRGNVFCFTFIPNDFGKLDLRDKELTIAADGLRLGREPDAPLFRPER